MKKINEEKYNYYFEQLKLVRKSKFFDSKWYKKVYNVKENAVEHYCKFGHLVGYNPSPKFSRIKYELIYEDVRALRTNPIWHFEKYGKYEDKFLSKQKISENEMKKIEHAKIEQEKNIREFSADEKNLIIFLVPELDIITGGILSINSIASVSKTLKNIHHSEVIMCTMPNEKTFDRYTKFDSKFKIYRFGQIRQYFKKIENITIHIPEIYVHPFLYFLTPEEQNWLKNIKYSKINILNQNIDFAPRPRLVNYLKEFAKEVTMTIAHKKYCVAQLRSSYDIPVHWLSTSNLVKYKYLNYSEKENILLYSPDDNLLKMQILEKIKENFPNLKQIEIKNMKYKDYLKNISKAKWMITFGEGLDGYFSESIRSGTLSFAVYNNRFFDEQYNGLKNIYVDYNEMLENIIKDIRKYDNEKSYTKLVNSILKIDEKQYNDLEYKNNIKKYYLKDYTFPINEIIKKRKILLEKNPLISIAMATYNGEKFLEKQLNSLFSQNYKNIEIIVGDDNSTDETKKILRKYKNKIKIIENQQNQGFVKNFNNIIKNCKGEYIALCDQDDIWENDKLEKLLSHIDEFDLIHSGITVINKKDEYHNEKIFHDVYEIDKTQLFNFSDYIRESQILGCTCLFKKNICNKLELKDDVIYHDCWIAMNAIKKGNGIIYLDETLTKYRQYGSNAAFKTFQNTNWSKRKICFDKYISKYFNLNNYEKKLIELDINSLKIKDIMKKYNFNNLDEFINKNYYFFTNSFIKSLLKEISKEDTDK